MAVLSVCFLYKEEQKRRVANKDKRGYKNATQHRCVALRRGGEIRTRDPLLPKQVR